MVFKKLPSISVLLPTLNSARVLEGCFKSIVNQDYPKDKIEIIVADGGSTDRTLEIAKRYGAKIYKSSLKTGEAGKAVALRQARGELVALIDSDNILPSKKWLKRMVGPFSDPEIVGSEPWEFTYRRQDSLVNRYCALIGANDPYCYFVGNYDKQSILSGKWTGLNFFQEDKNRYLKVRIKGNILPTIGANGTIWRTEVLKKAVGKSDYLFDTDIPYMLTKNGPFWLAKVKVGIVHLYCRTIGDFYRKQKRRARDFFYLEKEEERRETYQRQAGRQFYFILTTITILPLIFQSIKGFIRKPDNVWLFHPFACLLTLWIYGSETILARLGRVQMDRKSWRQ